VDNWCCFEGGVLQKSLGHSVVFKGSQKFGTNAKLLKKEVNIHLKTVTKEGVGLAFEWQFETKRSGFHGVNRLISTLIHGSTIIHMLSSACMCSHKRSCRLSFS
jgi:hypothetical protein